MEKTINYKLYKPELGDRVSIGDINENMDILDEKLKEVETLKIDKSRILSTKEELEAVTEEGFLVDALVAAQLNSDMDITDCTSSVTAYYNFHNDGPLIVSKIKNHIVHIGFQTVSSSFAANTRYKLLTLPPELLSGRPMSFGAATSSVGNPMQQSAVANIDKNGDLWCMATVSSNYFFVEILYII